jgi:hypothetical protein
MEAKFNWIIFHKNASVCDEGTAHKTYYILQAAQFVIEMFPVFSVFNEIRRKYCLHVIQYMYWFCITLIEITILTSVLYFTDLKKFIWITYLETLYIRVNFNIRHLHLTYGKILAWDLTKNQEEITDYIYIYIYIYMCVCVCVCVLVYLCICVFV